MCQDELRRRRLSPTPVVGVAHAPPKQTPHSDATYRLTRRVVSFHNTPNDAWVIYNSAVYDVTMFLESHPGGPDILYEHLGSDVTKLMHSDAVHEHSPFAFKLLEKHRIGQLFEDSSTDGHSTPTDGNIDPATGEELVKWDQPILPQVGHLGTRYFQWIHSFPTTHHTVKMFTNDTIESLTKCAWYVPLVFWLPILFAESAHYVYLIDGLSNIRPSVVASGVAIGMICWLLFEYSLHRWVFHWKSESYYGNIVHFLIHGHHHITPMDFDRLVFPPVPALILGAPFWYGVPKVLGIQWGYPWLVGFLIGYLVYDMTHFWIHHGVPKNALLKQQKRRHVHHHYFQPHVNFGISNPLFDYVFSTIKEPAQ